MKKPKIISAPFVFSTLLTAFFIFLIVKWISNSSTKQKFTEGVLKLALVSVFAFVGTYFKYKKDLKKYDEFVKQKQKQLDYAIEIAKRDKQREKHLLEIFEMNENAIEVFKKTFEIVQVNEYGDILLDNQSEIDKEYISNLVKLNEYLITKRKSIENQKIAIINFDFKDMDRNLGDIKNTEIEDSEILIEYKIDLLQKQNDFLKSLHYLSVKMIDYLLRNNLVRFYSIFHQFEKLGIFNKEWENRLLVLMEEINENILDVVQEIAFLEASISSSVFDLQLEISSKG